MKTGRVISPPAPRNAVSVNREEDFPALWALLVEMNARLTRIEERLTPRQPVDDIEILQKLLPAIGGKFGSNWFTTAEVLSDLILATLAAPLNAKQVGRLLARHADQDIGGFMLKRGPGEGGVSTWQLLEVFRNQSKTQGHSSPSPGNVV